MDHHGVTKSALKMELFKVGVIIVQLHHYWIFLYPNFGHFPLLINHAIFIFPKCQP